MMFVDADIFLELELEQEKWRDCEMFFRQIAENKIKAMTSDFLIYAIFLNIQNQTHSTKNMKKFLLAISNLDSLEIFRPNEKEWFNALNFMQIYSLDFDDALVISSMLANKIRKLISFDKHFDKVKEIERIEPKDIV